MSELVADARRVAYRRLVQTSKVDSHALGDVVVIPVTVTAALDGNVPLAGARKGRQSLDSRRDLLRIPGLQDAPGQDLSNACTSCHTTRDARWAATQVRAWYGHAPAPDHTSASRDARRRRCGRVDAQARLARAGQRSRATTHRARDSVRGVELAAGRGRARDADRRPARFECARPLRCAAVRRAVSARVAGASGRAAVVRLAAEPFASKRHSILAAVPGQRLSQEQQVAFERAAAEFVETQRYNADRAEARVSLGTFLAQRGDAARAEEELQSAIRLEPSSIPAYVNLADVYRAQGRDADGERILRSGLAERAEERRASLRARAGADASESRRHARCENSHARPASSQATRASPTFTPSR